MVTLITVLNDKNNLNLLKQNLLAVQSTKQYGLDIICITKDKELYLTCRDILMDDEDSESLVIYEKKATLEQAAKYISDKNEYVFLLKEGIKIPFDGLTQLLRDYYINNHAGFISALFNSYPIIYKIDDIYGKFENYHYKDSWEENSLVEVDTTPVKAMLTKTKLYKDIFCKDDLVDWKDYSYGVQLRRKGYKNFIDTKIKCGGI